MNQYGLIIDGKKIVTDETFGVRNPATGEVFARCSVATQAKRLASRLECGTAWVNDHGAIQPDALSAE